MTCSGTAVAVFRLMIAGSTAALVRRSSCRVVVLGAKSNIWKDVVAVVVAVAVAVVVVTVGIIEAMSRVILLVK